MSRKDSDDDHHLIGKVTHCYRKIGVAEVEICSDSRLDKGDKVAFLLRGGKEKGIIEITSMRINDKPVDCARGDERVHVFFGDSVPRRGKKIYLHSSSTPVVGVHG